MIYHVKKKLHGNDEAKLLELSTMLEQEVHYLNVPYLKKKGTKSNNKMKSNGCCSFVAIDASCRARVCRWIFHTISSLHHLSRDTAVVAISYLDRFMSSSSSSRAQKAWKNRREYQLVAMTCLYIAIKIHEPSFVIMNTKDISALSRGIHTAEDIAACERDILTSLRWRVNDVTSLQFMSRILDLLPESSSFARSEKNVWNNMLQADSQRQILLAVEDYAFVTLRRSSIAIAAIFNSLKTIPHDVFSSQEKIEFLQIMSETVGFDVTRSPLINAVAARLQMVSNKSSSASSSLSRSRINNTTSIRSPSFINPEQQAPTISSTSSSKQMCNNPAVKSSPVSCISE